jgi:predicted O-methyltransferase YrrM
VNDRAVSVTPAEAEALRAWVEREGATRTIEIGLGYGVSALAVCEGLHQWAVLRTPRVPPERRFDHVVEF